jgi:two-component system phosphate regulon response regulator OmpR
MSADVPHVLVVDDDPRLADLLRRYLGDNGFRVTAAASAADARGKLGSVTFDLLVLDVMMPGEDGLSLMRDLRRRNDVPILLLTAMGEVEDRIRGLEFGADDYLTKPFEPRELLLRLRTILRRTPPTTTPTELKFGRYRFDIGRRELWRGDEPIKLTPAEASLLSLFGRRPDRPIDRDDLVDGAADVNPRTVDVQIARLRRKIEPDPKFPRYLQTVRGRGYLFRTD